MGAVLAVLKRDANVRSFALAGVWATIGGG